MIPNVAKGWMLKAGGLRHADSVLIDALSLKVHGAMVYI